MIIMAAKSLTEITKKKVLTGPHIVAQGNLVRDQEVEAVTINLIETGAIRDIVDQREEIQGHPTGTLLVDMTTLKTEVQILTKVLPAQPILDKVILRMTVEIEDPTNVVMTS
jgi:predicted thioredoxin/glutaredoxin